MKPSDIVESGYDKAYKTYHKHRNIWYNKSLLNDFSRRLSKNSKILDVGCGSDLIAKFFIDKKFNVIGIDISKNILKLAMKKVPKAKFYRMDMRKIKFLSKSFDAITCFYSIIHVPRKFHIRILTKFYKLLKSKGLLLISVGLNGFESQVEKNWFGVEMYWSQFDKETNLKLIKKAGFKIIWSKSVGRKSDRHLFVLAQKT